MVQPNNCNNNHNNKRSEKEIKVKVFKVFILPDSCFIQCVMDVITILQIFLKKFYSSHIQLSVSVLRRRKKWVFHIFTFKMGAIKTDRPVRINTRVPVTLCSLKPNQKITNLPFVFINMLLPFHLQKILYIDGITVWVRQQRCGYHM